MDHHHSHTPSSGCVEEVDFEAKEAAHYRNVLHVLKTYRRHELSANNRRRRDFLALPSWQQRLLPDYLDLLSEIDGAVIRQQELLDAIASSASHGFLMDGQAVTSTAQELGRGADYDKVKSCIRQLVRDWSDEGRAEREGCYQPILDALQPHLKARPGSQPADFQVLVPGAGLARLVWEVVKLGASCQGNESSLYMLFVSNYLLNNTTQIKQMPIWPYIHSLSNVQTSEDVLRRVAVPDVLPGDLPAAGGSMSMTAGDFVEVYSRPEEKGRWDAILTCFFMDTASNVIEYLSTLRHALKPDGVWINLGPLLWHHENSDHLPSLELTLEDFKGLAGRMGFAVENERMVPTKYTSSPKSMMRYEYVSAFFTAKKMPPIKTSAT